MGNYCRREGNSMRGNIEQRGHNRWRLRVFAGRENGRTKFVVRNFQGTKRQAETALAKLVCEVEAGRAVVSHGLSLADQLDAWLADIAPTRSAYTVKEHRRCIEHDIKPALGPVPLDKLAPRQLDTFYRHMLARGLSPSSVRRFHSVLHAALDRAVKWGLIGTNPADRATPPALAHTTASAPAVSDVQRLLLATEQDSPIVAAAIALAAVTGARRGELCLLRWSDVNWQRRVLTIARSLTVIDGVATEGPTKTHQWRTVALDDALLAMLTRRRTAQEAYAEKVGVALVADPYVLSPAGDGSAPYIPDTLTDYYKRAAKKLGVATHFHGLRHFSATTAIAGGADVRTVAGRLGHADPSVTLRVYAHVLEARDRDLAGYLGSTVLGAWALALARVSQAHRSPLWARRAPGRKNAGNWAGRVLSAFRGEFACRPAPRAPERQPGGSGQHLPSEHPRSWQGKGHCHCGCPRTGDRSPIWTRPQRLSGVLEGTEPACGHETEEPAYALRALLPGSAPSRCWRRAPPAPRGPCAKPAAECRRQVGR